MSIYTFSEAELRSRFIKNIGNRDDIDVYIEVPVFCRSVDLVIQEKQNAEIFAIEFKLHDWKRAIQQAQSVGLCFDYLYICLSYTINIQHLLSLVKLLNPRRIHRNVRL